MPTVYECPHINNNYSMFKILVKLLTSERPFSDL